MVSEAAAAAGEQKRKVEEEAERIRSLSEQEAFGMLEAAQQEALAAKAELMRQQEQLKADVEQARRVPELENQLAQATQELSQLQNLLDNERKMILEEAQQTEQERVDSASKFREQSYELEQLKRALGQCAAYNVSLQ